MTLTRSNFGSLLLPVHSKIFFDYLKELGEQYSRIFKVEDMDRASVTEKILGGFGLWDENTEGNTVNEDTMSEGDEVTFNAARYDKGYSVTWELVKDDYRGVLSGLGKNGSARTLAKGLNATVETLAASILNNGFGNTGYDGKALFANNHPLTDSASDCSNLATGALSYANLKLALTLMRQTVDEAGIQIKCIPGKLIVPNELEFTAKEILNSQRVAGELSNTETQTPGLQLEVMDYLTDSDAWFIQAKNTENLVFKWREKPWFDMQFIPRKVDKFFFGFARMTCGYRNWRGICGSSGA